MASLISGSHIYTGFWIDWSKGVVAGSTFTLTSRYGAVLTAFLAFFVTIIGACLWRICCYFLHQWYSTPEARDGIHHQHQLIFRNTTSAAAASRAFVEHAFSWRKTGMRSWSRSLPLAAFATTFMVGFGVASLMTSLVTKAAGSSRLVVSDNCGFFAIDNSSKAAGTAMYARDLALTNTASNYARTCYGADNVTSGLQCQLFTKRTLPYSVNTKADCPFGDGICNSTAFSLDTNRLNSLADFGVNTRKSGQVDIRKITTCAPLKQTGYVRTTKADGQTGVGAFNDTIRHFSYGGWLGVSGAENDTYLYNQHAFVDGYGYQFEAIIHVAGENTAAWQPIKALKRDDADTTIMFLAPNSIQFTEPNDDAFFHANYEVPLTIAGRDETFWLSDNWVNVMACTDQYQLCNPLLSGSDSCTPLVGSHNVLPELSKIKLNGVQQVTASLLYYNLRETSVYYSIYNRGAGALRVQETVNLLAQAPIAQNQWHLEVTTWFDTALAKLQRAVMSYAAGPEHVTAGSHVQRPFEKLTASFCYSQKVAVTSDTISFSVLGVAVILAVGALIIALYFVLESVVGWLQRRYNWSEYRRVRWIMDDKMQLQRMAFEEAGMGKWSKLSSNVPVTEKGQVFGGLSHVDYAEPRLGEGWTADGVKKTGLAAAVAEQEARYSANITYVDDVHYREHQQELEMQRERERENEKKNGPTVYERPVYQSG